MAEPRTEAQVAADTVVTLLVEGMLKRRQMVAATAAVGLVSPDITEALQRRKARGFVKPAGATPDVPPDDAQPSSRFGPAKPCPKGCGRYFSHLGRHLAACRGGA